MSEAIAAADPSRGVYPVPAGARTGFLWDALRGVLDPEIPISIVDLGLVYDLRWTGDGVVSLDLTFTASGCPCMMFIRMDVEEALLRIDEVRSVEIREVWDPPWTRERVTPEGREALKRFGVGI